MTKGSPCCPFVDTFFLQFTGCGPGGSPLHVCTYVSPPPQNKGLPWPTCHRGFPSLHGPLFHLLSVLNQFRFMEEQQGRHRQSLWEALLFLSQVFFEMAFICSGYAVSVQEPSGMRVPAVQA